MNKIELVMWIQGLLIAVLCICASWHGVGNAIRKYTGVAKKSDGKFVTGSDDVGYGFRFVFTLIAMLIIAVGILGAKVLSL